MKEREAAEAMERPVGHKRYGVIPKRQCSRSAPLVRGGSTDDRAKALAIRRHRSVCAPRWPFDNRSRHDCLSSNTAESAMHNNKKAVSTLLPVALAGAVALSASQSALAEIVLYDQDDTRFSTDGYFNTFYVHSDVDRAGEQFDRKQSRVKMGFLPNYIGFNFSKQVEDLKLGGRSSFWVTINDSDTNGTETGIDVRQFYATVSDDAWGEVLFGKDFGLFARSNILLDEMLTGYGQVSDTLG